MATILVLITHVPALLYTRLIICFFAIGIPSTVAWAGFARFSPEDEHRNPPAVALICFLLAFVPSIGAISLILASASTLAAIIFPATCYAWFVVLNVVRDREDTRPINGEPK